jgi:outer membrane protein insertion porin family
MKERAMRSIFFAAIVGLPACCAAFPLDANVSQQGAKRPTPPGTLHSVVVKGNQLYSSADIVKESGLKDGERVDRAVIDKARQKLQSTELFNSVAYQYRIGAGPTPTYDVTFEVAENEQIFPMRFERLGMPPDAVRSCVREHVDLYADRIPGTEGVLKRYTSAVERCVAQGKQDVKVKAAISNDDPKQLTVLFSPEAAAPTISQVEVSGNQAIDTGTILRAVNQVAIGVPLSDMRLKMILDGTIRPLYAAKGYAAVSFPKITTEPAKTNLGVIVKVEINDGPSFKFGSIRFRGSGLDEDEIRSTIPFKSGQTFDSEKVDNYRLDLVHKMRRHGMLDASISVETQPDDSKRAVNLIYNVTPGATYNFQNLDIRGLDITSEPVIAKLWGEKAGHPFNPDYPDFFLKRVQEQGLFDHLADTHSDYTADASTHNVTVHLYFKGGDSKSDRARKKQEEAEKNQVDGSWSPYPYVSVDATPSVRNF